MYSLKLVWPWLSYGYLSCSAAAPKFTKQYFGKNISWFKVRLHHRSIISLSTRDLVKRVCIIIRERLLCWGFFIISFIFFIQISGVNIVMTDRMVVIHPQTSEFFNSPLTKCCFAACFRWGMVLNAGWIETSLETISFLAESYPLWRQENFIFMKKRVLFWRKNHQ